MNDIREYRTYRDFLKACLEGERAGAKGNISVKTFAERLGLSASSLRMILAGKRNLTVCNILVIAKSLKMTIPQTELFEAFVLRDQSTNRSEQLYYAKKINRHSLIHPLHTKRVADTDILRDPKLPAILVHLMDDSTKYKKLQEADFPSAASELGISVDRLKTLLAWASQHKILDGAGKHSHLVFDRLIQSIGQSNYIKDAFSRAADVAGRNSKSEPKSLFSVKTFSIPYADLRQFGDEYKALAERYMGKQEKVDSIVATVLFAALPEPKLAP